MVEHLTDDDLRKLPRGGHDYRKLYAAYKTAVEHEGSPTVILAKTVKGWTLGADFEARNATHQIKKMTPERAARRSATGCYLDDPRRRSSRTATRRTSTPATDSPEYEYLMERRRALDGFLPERVERSKTIVLSRATSVDRPTARRAPARRCRRRRRPRSRGCCATCCSDPDIGRARRADHPRRGAHVRPRRAVPRVQDLRAVRPAVRAGRRRAAALVPRGEQRPDPRGGDHRGRLDGVVHRRRHRVRDVGPADDPVLHLLFDVRVPAGRRPRSGRSATSGAAASCSAPPPAARRSPARACSTATARASCYALAYPNCRPYDPAFAYEVARDRPRRHRAHVRRPSPRTASTTSPSTTRTTRSRRCPRASRTASCAASTATAPRAERRARTARRSSPAAPMMLAALDAQQMLAERLRRRRRRVERDRATSSSATTRSSAERWNRLHPTEPPRTPYVTEQLARQRGPGRRGHRLREGGARPDRPVRARSPFVVARHRRLRLLRHPGRAAAPLRGRRRRTIVVAVLHGLAQTGRRQGARWSPRRSRRYEIDPDRVDPASVAVSDISKYARTAYVNSDVRRAA